MKIVMLGPPGAGKGTQAALLAQSLGIPTLSTGNILRAAIKEGLPVGLEAQKYMDSGKLVPDDVIIGVVRDYLAREEFASGVILDGMPRTVNQAEMLEKMGVGISGALALDISDEEIEARMSSRRVCLNCGATYSLTVNPPKKEGVCDKCGEKVVIRDDDRPETVRERLAVYHEQTEPIIAFYAERGILRRVDGTLSVEEITKKLEEALETLK